MNDTTNTVGTADTMADITRNGLVSMQRAADYLGVKDTRTVKKLVRAGRLHAKRIGSRILITSKSLRDFVAA